MPRALGALVRVGPTQSSATISRPGEPQPPPPRDTKSSTLTRRLPAITPKHQRLFLTAARTLVSLIRHSVVSIVVAWLLACIYAYGTHIPELAESPPSYPAVVTTIIVLGTCCLSQASLLVDALAMTTLHRADDPEKCIELKAVWWTLLSRTLPVFIATEVATGLTSFAITSGSTSLRPWHLYFYAGNWIIAFFHAAASVEIKRVFQLETVEGLALGHVNKSSYAARLLVAYVRTSFLPFSMALAATIVHGCLRLAITTNVELVIFSLASVFVKSAILRCTKTIVLSRGVNIDIKRVYVYTVVPTVLINTQVRLFLMRTKPQWSVGGFLLLAILEPAMRVVKIKLLERELRIRSRLARSSFMLGSTWSLFETIPRDFAAKGSRAVVPHPSSAIGEHSGHQRHPSKLLSDRQAFLQWRATVMQFVAAELEAVRDFLSSSAIRRIHS